MNIPIMSYFSSAGRILFFPIFLASFFGLIHCNTTFGNMKTLVEGSKAGVFVLDGKKYPKSLEIKKELKPGRKFPALTRENFIAILGNLKFKKDGFWGTRKGALFYQEELDQLAGMLAEVLPRVQPHQRLVLIAHHDPDTSVLSRRERVTALLWADAEGVHLVLGEVREEMPLDEFFDEAEWQAISPIEMKSSGDSDSELLPSPDFTYKKIKGVTHKLWAVFNYETIAKIELRRESGEKKPKKDVVDRSEAFEKKRRLLEQARRARLITQAEYEKKLRELREQEEAGTIEERIKLLKKTLEEKLITLEEYEAKVKKLREAQKKEKEIKEGRKDSGKGKGKKKGGQN